MALDGAFLYAVKNELEILINSRCDKVFQPSRDEIIITLRTHSGTKKLLISSNANSARVHITNTASDNPKTPPMFCMLLRKRLGGSKLINIRQNGLERILFFDFECVNEIGDIEVLTLASEIMGRHSNIVLIDPQGKVIDSIKRVGTDKSRVRLILPGVQYTMPPNDGRISFIDSDIDTVSAKIRQQKNSSLSKAIMSALLGISPILAREWSFFACKGDIATENCTDEIYQRLSFAINRSKTALTNNSCEFCIVCEKNGTLKDFSFLRICQYGALMITKDCASACETLDLFFEKQSAQLRIRQRANDLLKLLSGASERIERKLINQKEELIECDRKDYLKLCGDLISANIYRISNGDTALCCENFYSENQEQIEIPLDSKLSPAQNAQKYYTEYRKKTNAKVRLQEQIQLGTEELSYISSVFDSLTRAETEDDIMLIRQELTSSGYIRQRKQKGIKPREMPPHEYFTSDGFKVLVGRNNVQNDKLTFKIADKHDIWLHTKDIPGSHVIIAADSREISETAIAEAAVIAAKNSKANGSNQVPVDWCLVKYVKKPNGAKPGKVIFTHNKTIFVDSLENGNAE